MSMMQTRLAAHWLHNDFKADRLRFLEADIDALVIASPSPTHVDYLHWALAHSIPVLVEKPLALRPEDSIAFVNAESIKVGHCERFNPAFEQLDPPSEGPVVVRRMAQSLVDTKPADVIFDLMIHDLDLLQLYGGNVIDLAVTEVQTWACGFLFVLVLREQNGGSSPTYWRPRFMLALKEAGRSLNTGSVLTFIAEAFADDLPLPRRGEQDALSLQWQAFRAALSGHTTKVASAREAHSAVVLAQRIYQLAAGMEYAHAS